MRFVRQFLIIVAFSFLGELLHILIPAPIPASVYGLLLLFAALCLKIVKLEQVKETSVFLLEVMPIMFIPAAVGLIDSWGVISGDLPAYVIIIAVTTLFVMSVSGIVTQAVIRGRAKK